MILLSKIVKYVNTNLHRCKEPEHLFFIKKPIVCLIITSMSIFQCLGSVQVSFLDYCCTVWVLLHRSIMGLYAYVQLNQNAMKNCFTNKKVTVSTKKTTHVWYTQLWAYISSLNKSTCLYFGAFLSFVPIRFYDQK